MSRAFLTSIIVYFGCRLWRYFVNKRDDGSSDLYSLFDYMDFRDTMDMEKAYLQGRFDAIPYLSKPSPLARVELSQKHNTSG